MDVFFKVRAPRDSIRRVRPYPGTKRGLFASPDYIAAYGNPVTPDELAAHSCIGSGTWKLSRGLKVAVPQYSLQDSSQRPWGSSGSRAQWSWHRHSAALHGQTPRLAQQIGACLAALEPGADHAMRTLLRPGADDSQSPGPAGFPGRIHRYRSRSAPSPFACEGIIYLLEAWGNIWTLMTAASHKR